MDLNIEKFYKAYPTMSHRRNRFPFKKEVNFDMKMGEIVPLCIIRAIPGITYNLDMSTVLKIAPLQVPPMDNAIFKAWAFYNPDRNTWDNYKYWFGEKQKPENPEEEPTYLVPKVLIPKPEIDINNYEKATEEEKKKYKERFGTFFDNIGCPPEAGGYKIDAFMSRTDRMIYNNYFRNQSLENSLEVNTGDADDDYEQNAKLRKLCKPRDFFTQLLPTQSGTTPVEIPLGSQAPVIGIDQIKIEGTDGNNLGGIVRGGVNGTSDYRAFLQSNVTGPAGQAIKLAKENSGIIADLSKAMGAPLEGLYQAIAYNTFQYITSRGGNRYFEMLSNVYGTVNPDLVLRIPEFLGSVTQMIEFDTVTQTSEASNKEGTGLGDRAANGYCESYGSIINKSFGEFGWIIIYGAVTHYPKYQQGVSKLMQTEDPLELFNPIFNLMGDEAIFRSEIYIQSDDVVNENGEPVNNEVLGYGKRNSRILYPIDEIHGRQRSSYPESLDTSHFGEYYTEMPTLNKEFDKVSDESFKRALQITDETQFMGNLLITGTTDAEIPTDAIPSPIPSQLQLQ